MPKMRHAKEKPGNYVLKYQKLMTRNLSFNLNAALCCAQNKIRINEAGKGTQRTNVNFFKFRKIKLQGISCLLLAGNLVKINCNPV